MRHSPGVAGKKPHHGWCGFPVHGIALHQAYFPRTPSYPLAYAHPTIHDTEILLDWLRKFYYYGYANPTNGCNPFYDRH